MAFRICLILFSLFFISLVVPDWGFYGHKKINRKAVFTLPSEMIRFYKENIEFITDHSVDPDKRRYATKFEAYRHYIDLDHWGSFPFNEVPRDFPSAILKYGKFGIVDSNNDSIWYKLGSCWSEESKSELPSIEMDCSDVYDIYNNLILPEYYTDEIFCSCDSFRNYFAVDSQTNFLDCQKVVFKDSLRKYGVLPYWLPQIYNRLVEAFSQQNEKNILRLSAEIGHYIGDGHVPLHTTENYNGQFTDQIGIHAFWESRLPELFADEEYDFFVGKAEYIDDIKKYSWDMVLSSHSELQEVLDFEKSLSETFPQDQQYCFDERNEYTVRTQCKEYSRAYHNSMDGMVERRMQDAVHAIGSFWYSAWLDAGQPSLELDDLEWTEEEKEQQNLLEKQFREGNINGREHDG